MDNTVDSVLEPIKEKMADTRHREKKQMSFNLPNNLIKEFDQGVNILSDITKINYTRNLLLEVATETYINRLKHYLQDEVNEPYLSNCLKDSKQYNSFDTIICSGSIKAFSDSFLKKGEWKHIRIKYEKLKEIKYIAVYITKPVQMITHYAKVTCIKPSCDVEGKYDIEVEKPIELGHYISLGKINSASTRAHKYTLLSKLKLAREYKDL